MVSVDSAHTKDTFTYLVTLLVLSQCISEIIDKIAMPCFRLILNNILNTNVGDKVIIKHWVDYLLYTIDIRFKGTITLFTTIAVSKTVKYFNIRSDGA